MSTVEQLTAERDAALAEAGTLRRQLAHMTQWRDSAIVDGNEARAEAYNLRRQLDEAQAGRLAEVKRSVHASMALARAEAELATLRRQLAECRADAPKHLRAEDQRLRNAAQRYEEQLLQAEAEAAALRRQLAKCQEHRNQLRSAFALAADNPDIPEYVRDAMRDTLASTRR